MKGGFMELEELCSIHENLFFLQRDFGEMLLVCFTSKFVYTELLDVVRFSGSAYDSRCMPMVSAQGI
jgi:hypothetical protein